MAAIVAWTGEVLAAFGSGKGVVDLLGVEEKAGIVVAERVATGAALAVGVSVTVRVGADAAADVGTDAAVEAGCDPHAASTQSVATGIAK
ncbi:MAG TPA: hypothetical protein VN108_10700 [Marmoricola sp.]|nr:hypothetical protein [Marmoricola sp.]